MLCGFTDTATVPTKQRAKNTTATRVARSPASYQQPALTVIPTAIRPPSRLFQLWGPSTLWCIPISVNVSSGSEPEGLVTMEFSKTGW